MKTYTPDLTPAVLDRLRDYACLFAEAFPQPKPAPWPGVYLRGLLLAGEPRATEPPLDLRLYLPESWLKDEARLDKAGVPAGERRPLTKPELGLELLDRVRAEGLPGWAVVADAGYGVSGDFRAGLESRQLSYIVGVT